MEEEEDIGCLKTYWFTYLIFCTTRSVVDNENTRKWMVHCRNVYHSERYYAECPCYRYIYSLLTLAFISYLDTSGGRLIHIVARYTSSSIRCHTHAGFLPLQVAAPWVLKRWKSSTCFSLIRCTYVLDCHCPLTCLIFLLISQIFNREPVSKMCDVYSFGILLWEIVTYQRPFSNCLHFLVPMKVLEGEVSATHQWTLNSHWLRKHCTFD